MPLDRQRPSFQQTSACPRPQQSWVQGEPAEGVRCLPLGRCPRQGVARLAVTVPADNAACLMAPVSWAAVAPTD